MMLFIIQDTLHRLISRGVDRKTTDVVNSSVLLEHTISAQLPCKTTSLCECQIFSVDVFQMKTSTRQTMI